MTEQPWFIGQALTHHALNGLGGTLDILNPEGSPFVVSEIKLAQIPLQMLGADMVVNAGDAPLEGNNILDSVGA